MLFFTEQYEVIIFHHEIFTDGLHGEKNVFHAKLRAESHTLFSRKGNVNSGEINLIQAFAITVVNLMRKMTNLDKIIVFLSCLTDCLHFRPTDCHPGKVVPRAYAQKLVRALARACDHTSAGFRRHNPSYQ